jgi:hypothetical protein
MKYCDKCGIKIHTNHDYCPLCHQTLTLLKEEEVIEKYPQTKSQLRPVSTMFKKVLMFLSTTGIIVLLTINFFTGFQRPWSLIPIGSIVYFWIFISVGFLSKTNIAAKLFIIFIVAIFFVYMIDELSASEGWALDYVAPLLLFTCNLAISFIILIKRMNYRDYISYLFLIALFSIIPLILILLGVIAVLWPAITSFGLALFILLFIIFFFPKSIKDEIKKRFHA